MQNRRTAIRQTQTYFSSKTRILAHAPKATTIQVQSTTPIVRRPVRSVAAKPRQRQDRYIGGAERDRTADPLLAKQVLSQLSYSPIQVSIPDRKPPNRSRAPRPQGTARPERSGKAATASGQRMVGPGRLELPTSRLSGVRSNHLSSGPMTWVELCRTAGPCLLKKEKRGRR